jgi:transcriptional regulator with XRE-family HTH domain
MGGNIRCKSMPVYAIQLSTLRQRIRECRLERGYTQEMLATKAGLGEKYLQNLEAGRRANPGIEVLNQIAQALEVHVFVLLYTQEELIVIARDLKKS